MTKLTIKKIFVYFLVIVLYFIFIHKLAWYTKEHVDKPKLPGRTEKQIATVGPGTTPATTIIQTLLQGKYLELPSFKKWLLLKFCILIKFFVFCSILTKLGQIAVLMGIVIWPSLVKIWLKTKNFYHYAKFWQDPFLNFANSSITNTIFFCK